MEIIIEGWKKPPMLVEMVECKGLGHPDTICDMICEACSQALSRFYLGRFAKVLHHNIDKAVLVAGKSEPKFKGGEVREPMKLIIVGRATSKAGNIVVPVKDICKKAASTFLKEKLGLEGFDLEVEIKEGASNLKQVMKKVVANDTSIGVGHYPPTALEKVVSEVADFMVSKEFQAKHKYVGKDVKVMGLRVGNEVKLTVAIAFVGKYISSMTAYKAAKKVVKKELEARFKHPVSINTLDSYEDEGSIYLTVTGLSAEMGDDGGAGRGNRYNGLITPYQPMSIESYAGKNINHPGKIYQVMAQKIAKELVEEHDLKSCDVKLLTKIGAPLDQPEMASIAVDGKCSEDDVKRTIERMFKRLQKIQREVVFGKEYK